MASTTHKPSLISIVSSRNVASEVIRFHRSTSRDETEKDKLPTSPIRVTAPFNPWIPSTNPTDENQDSFTSSNNIVSHTRISTSASAGTCVSQPPLSPRISRSLPTSPLGASSLFSRKQKSALRTPETLRPRRCTSERVSFAPEVDVWETYEKYTGYFSAYDRTSGKRKYTFTEAERLSIDDELEVVKKELFPSGRVFGDRVVASFFQLSVVVCFLARLRRLSRSRRNGNVKPENGNDSCLKVNEMAGVIAAAVELGYPTLCEYTAMCGGMVVETRSKRLLTA